MGFGKGFPQSGTRAGKGTISTPELAALLGISRQRVNELGRAGKITREPDGRWDPDRVRQALGRNLDARQQSPARDRATPPAHRVGAGGGRKPKAEQQAGEQQEGEHPPKGTLAYEQYRLTKEKADREGYERRKLERELVEAEAVEAEWADIGVKLRDAVMGIPSRACNRLPAEWRRDVATVLEDEARQILTMLSDEIRSKETAQAA